MPFGEYNSIIEMSLHFHKHWLTTAHVIKSQKSCILLLFLSTKNMNHSIRQDYWNSLSQASCVSKNFPDSFFVVHDIHITHLHIICTSHNSCSLDRNKTNMVYSHTSITIIITKKSIVFSFRITTSILLISIQQYVDIQNVLCITTNSK